jgi:hypothetical protein
MPGPVVPRAPGAISSDRARWHPAGISFRGWNSTGRTRVLRAVGALVSPGPDHCLHGIPSGWSHDAPFAVRRPAHRLRHALASRRSGGAVMSGPVFVGRCPAPQPGLAGMMTGPPGSRRASTTPSGRDLPGLAQLGREGLPHSHLLQRGRTEWPLRRLGRARAVRDRDPGCIQVTPLAVTRTLSDRTCGCPPRAGHPVAGREHRAVHATRVGGPGRSARVEAKRNDQDWMNVSRSGLSTSACVVSIPCG